MYDKTITLFCKRSADDTDRWYPYTLHNVNLNIDRSSIIKQYGQGCNDNCVLNVRNERGYKYLKPKEWERADTTTALTFRTGDFFMVGDVGITQPVDDARYARGFYDHMNRNYDDVYMITSVSRFDLIPHFQITGR